MVTGTEYTAAEDVAGSKLILEFSDLEKILIDMGMEYRDGEFEDPIPFPTTGINNLLLTHPHADHIGQVIKLCKAGFKGGIFTPYASADIATKIQLPQQANNFWMHNKRAQDLAKKGIYIPRKKVLWGYRDFKNIRDTQFRYFEEPEEGKKVQLGFPYETPIEILNKRDTKVTATFYEAGHIPGSSQILLEIEDKGVKSKILTSFDLGRTDYHIKGHPIADTPIVKAPHTDFPEDIDSMVIEATYGNKTHSGDDPREVLEDVINHTAKKNGQLIIGAFSIMRTHMLQYYLYDLDLQGKLPDNMHFYVTSPGADKCGRIMLKHQQDLDEEAIKRFIDKKDNFFYFDRLTHHNKVQQTKDALAQGDAINPCGWLASSGMFQGGRIERLLRNGGLQDPRNTILATGYQSPGTRGYDLINGATKIPFLDGGIIERKAEVRRMHGLSGHADIEELVAHVKNVCTPEESRRRDKMFRVYVKHGEKESCWAVKARLEKEGYVRENNAEVVVMKKGKSYDFGYRKAA
ncbi:MBL fold metallo-hydrolase [Candidatus Pacearchaeota archaeon]|nr:MBL fold metallo-hydrolase [Candidatus Pacearchaeota archaeon]